MSEMSPGHYNARAIKSHDGEYERASPTKGTTCYQFNIQIEDGPHKGRTFEWTGWTTDAAMMRTLEQIQVAGARVNRQTFDVDWSALGTTVFRIQIKEENGVLRAGFIGSGFDSVSAAEKEKTRARIAAALAKAGEAPKADPNDNVPF